MIKYLFPLVLGISIASMAEIPNFKDGFRFLHADGEKWITDGKYPTFTHADWDQDGDKDILAGYMYTATGTAGHIVYYENTGNNESPNYVYKMKFPISVGGA